MFIKMAALAVSADRKSLVDAIDRAVGTMFASSRQKTRSGTPVILYKCGAIDWCLYNHRIQQILTAVEGAPSDMVEMVLIGSTGAVVEHWNPENRWLRVQQDVTC